MAIKLMIDSASDINQEEANKLGITLLPIEVRFGDEEYLDGVNLLPHEFYEKLEGCKELPKTSQINPFRYEEAFEEVTKNGDEVIVITLSSKLSGTYLSAVQASEKFAGKVYVIDSLNACLSERILGLYALDLIKAGKSAQEIIDELNQAKTKINVMATINTLKYLKMGGRISSLVAFAGEAFSVKPVVAVVDGEVKMIGKAIGFKKGNQLVIKMAKEKEIDLDKPFGLIYSGNDDTTVKKFAVETASLWGDKQDKINKYILGSTIGTHIGSGAVGFAFFEK